MFPDIYGLAAHLEIVLRLKDNREWTVLMDRLIILENDITLFTMTGDDELAVDRRRARSHIQNRLMSLALLSFFSINVI